MKRPLSPQDLPASVYLVPVQVLHKLIDVLLLAVLVINVEGVFVNVADYQRLPQPDNANFVQVARHVVELPVRYVSCEHPPAVRGHTTYLKILDPAVEGKESFGNGAANILGGVARFGR